MVYVIGVQESWRGSSVLSSMPSSELIVKHLFSNAYEF